MTTTENIVTKGLRLKPGIFLTWIFFICCVLETNAQGNLMINPRRIVFEGERRMQELNLANTGNDTATYNVSFIQYRMKEDGGFEMITEPDSGQQFADKYLRFFPRSVTLAPNEAQVVKVQLSKTADLKPGEYRSHVYFRAVPKPTALGTEENLADSNVIGVKLSAIFGITIPVIIRVGTSDAKVALSNLSVDLQNDTLPRLRVTFKRDGNMSVYGDLTVTYQSPSGKKAIVGNVKGIAVYTPNRRRQFQVDLDRTLGFDYGKGKFHVEFTAQSDQKNAKLAEADLEL